MRARTGKGWAWYTGQLAGGQAASMRLLLAPQLAAPALSGVRHSGHFWWRHSQLSEHLEWKQWWQALSSRTSSPRRQSDRQMAQVVTLSGPAPPRASAADRRRRGMRHSAA